MPGHSNRKKRRRRMGAVLTLFFVITAIAAPARALQADEINPQGGAGTTQTIDLTVEAAPAADFSAGYLQVSGTMNGTLQRADGTSGSYKVPFFVAYPAASGTCNGAAILDIPNSVFYEAFAHAGTPDDFFFPSVFPIAQSIVFDPALQDKGYVYGFAQWNKLVIERQRESGTLADESLHIDEAADGNAILRDLSRMLREPSTFFGSQDSVPCSSSDVIGFGDSQTGMFLRGFLFARLNSGLASAPVFDDGLVSEGTFQAVPGSRCRHADSASPWYRYSTDGCTGATPADQGRTIVINTETDMQTLEGWKARPEDGDNAGHYRVYELAGVSHLPESWFPLKAVGFRDPTHLDQNYVDRAPVYRAMFEHMRAWLQQDQAPPPNALIEGGVGQLASPIFSGTTASSGSSDTFVAALGADRNTLGGVRLPHLRTTLDDGREIGAPLGVYRGTHCNNDTLPATFILDCQMSGDGEVFNIIGGTFTPYTSFDASICAAFYGNPGRYTSAVNTGVNYAIAQGWILREERRAIVNAAEARADQHRECVSEPLPAVNITVTIDATVDPGAEWVDGDGYHLRDQRNLETVSGDFEGQATVTVNVDAGPDSTAVWVEVDISTSEGRWDGRYAQITANGETEARGLLIGRAGYAGQVMILDRVVAETDSSLSLAGHLLEMTRPHEGMSLAFDLCLDGSTGAGGGFLGRGPVPADGSASASFTVVGASGSGMIWGDIELSKADGTLHGYWIESATPHPNAGNFVLLGGSGAYEATYGFGRTIGSLHDADHCASGSIARSTWIGEVTR